jgi:hypothetical protein
VLIDVDAELGAKNLLNSRMAHVAVSRGAYDAQLYTNDREKLPQALGHDVSQQSALMPAMKPEPKITPRQEISRFPRVHGTTTDPALKSVCGTLTAPDDGSIARAQPLSRPT